MSKQVNLQKFSENQSIKIPNNNLNKIESHGSLNTLIRIDEKINSGNSEKIEGENMYLEPKPKTPVKTKLIITKNLKEFAKLAALKNNHNKGNNIELNHNHNIVIPGLLKKNKESSKVKLPEIKDIKNYNKKKNDKSIDSKINILEKI